MQFFFYFKGRIFNILSLFSVHVTFVINARQAIIAKSMCIPKMKFGLLVNVKSSYCFLQIAKGFFTCHLSRAITSFPSKFGDNLWYDMGYGPSLTVMLS